MEDDVKILLDLIKGSKGIIKCLRILVFILANFILLIIFSNFITTHLHIYIILLILAIFLNLLIIIPHTKISDYLKNPRISDFLNFLKKLEIGLLNRFILVIRYMFFNILNDLFILTIIWLAILFIFYSLKLVDISNNFINLVAIITLIGVLSGLFQFYYKNYKEQVFKIMQSLTQYVTKEVNKISFNDFLRNLDEKSRKLIQSTIVSSSEKFPIQGSRPKKLIYVPPVVTTTSVFDYIDYLVENELVKEKELDFSKLNEMYKIYFERKLEEFKEEVKKKDFTEVRNLLFSNLMFFDEFIAELAKVNLELPLDLSHYEEREPKGFREHYTKFAYDCVVYTLYYLFFGQKSNQLEVVQEQKHESN